MRGVGREVVLNALLVADVYHNVVEHACGRAVADGYRQAALQHILQQSHRLQTDRLSARIRTADNQQPFLSGEDNVEWDGLLALFLQRQLQQGVNGVNPVQMGLGLHFGLESLRQLGQFRLGVDQVYLCQELVGVENIVHMGPELVGKHGEYAYDLASLGSLQLAHLVVGLYYLCRLNKHGLSRGRLIVHNTAYLSLHARRYGNHQSTVANGGCHILVHQPVFLGGVQYSI